MKEVKEEYDYEWIIEAIREGRDDFECIGQKQKVIQLEINVNALEVKEKFVAYLKKMKLNFKIIFPMPSLQ